MQNNKQARFQVQDSIFSFTRACVHVAPSGHVKTQHLVSCLEGYKLGSLDINTPLPQLDLVACDPRCGPVTPGVNMTLHNILQMGSRNPLVNSHVTKGGWMHAGSDLGSAAKVSAIDLEVAGSRPVNCCFSILFSFFTMCSSLPCLQSCIPIDQYSCVPLINIVPSPNMQG